MVEFTGVDDPLSSSVVVCDVRLFFLHFTFARHYYVDNNCGDDVLLAWATSRRFTEIGKRVKHCDALIAILSDGFGRSPMTMVQEDGSEDYEGCLSKVLSLLPLDTVMTSKTHEDDDCVVVDRSDSMDDSAYDRRSFLWKRSNEAPHRTPFRRALTPLPPTLPSAADAGGAAAPSSPSRTWRPHDAIADNVRLVDEVVRLPTVSHNT